MLAKHLPILTQRLVPQHGLSRLIGILTNCQRPKIKDWCIRRFIKRYAVNMSEALEENPENYVDFNHFFTRSLKPDARPIVQGKTQIACPVDGSISQLGKIENGRIFQAKGFSFDLVSLLGGSERRAQPFAGGSFATLYLAPKDYHRVHMPLAGTLHEMLHIPGSLFSVNPKTTQSVSALFARNERVVTLFDTAAGPMAVILVGAMLVASIHTVWAGKITPPGQSKPRVWAYNQGATSIHLVKGVEMGHFELGSTVLLLFGANAMQWADNLKAGQTVRMGQLLGEIV